MPSAAAGFELEEQAAKKLLASMILAMLKDKNFLIKLCMYINILSLLVLFDNTGELYQILSNISTYIVTLS